MAKTWYPVIDYLTCTDCGTCVVKCPHGVYDTAKAPSPVVKKPEACVDHCHGCGNRCPVGAITYVGEDTGWTPQNGEQTESCCSCGCGAASEKKIVVEYLYLDLETCDRCIGTDSVLDEVMMTLTPALNIAGFEVEYNKIELKKPRQSLKQLMIPRQSLKQLMIPRQSLKQPAMKSQLPMPMKHQKAQIQKHHHRHLMTRAAARG